MAEIFDVVVVGAGPGGSAAAKRCAEKGLKTLVLEKRPLPEKLPQNKVCAAMLMSSLSQSVIKHEFGNFPSHLLTTPSVMAGGMFHVPGVGKEKVEHPMPISWRMDLDEWMRQAAQKKGAAMRDKANVTGITEDRGGYLVHFRRGGQDYQVRAKYLVAADGPASPVRSMVFPDLKVPNAHGFQECYQGELGLDKNYFHLFFDPQYGYFSIHHKNDYFLLAGRAEIGAVKTAIEGARKVLARDWGLSPEAKPLWRGARLTQANLHEPTFGSFAPSKDNVMLVGDAAAIRFPITGEGIGPAVTSGLMAASAIVQASTAGGKAGELYTKRVKELMSRFAELYPIAKQLSEQRKKGGPALLEMLREHHDIAFKKLVLPKGQTI